NMDALITGQGHAASSTRKLNEPSCYGGGNRIVGRVGSIHSNDRAIDALVRPVADRLERQVLGFRKKRRAPCNHQQEATTRTPIPHREALPGSVNELSNFASGAAKLPSLTKDPVSSSA